MTVLIDFCIDHQFWTGFVIGGCFFGGISGMVGWLIGYDTALGKISRKLRGDHILGEMPLTTARRRFPTTPGRTV